jgi:hypothetical protein
MTESRSEMMRRLWADPRFRARQSEGLRARWRDPDYREKVSAARREQWRAWRQEHGKREKRT